MFKYLLAGLRERSWAFFLCFVLCTSRAVLPSLTKPYSLGRSLIVFGGVLVEQLFCLSWLEGGLRLGLNTLLLLSVLTETLGTFTSSLSKTKVTT